jgi:hypothetical protein
MLPDFFLERKNDEYEYRFVAVTQQVDSNLDRGSGYCRRLVGVPAREVVHQSEGE